jgi:hypothetical protein
VLLPVPRRLGNGVSSNGLVVITSEFLLFDLIYQWREQRVKSEKKIPAGQSWFILRFVYGRAIGERTTDSSSDGSLLLLHLHHLFHCRVCRSSSHDHLHLLLANHHLRPCSYAACGRGGALTTHRPAHCRPRSPL